MARIQTLDWGSPFETLVAELAQALQDWHGPNNLPCQTSRTPSGRGLVYLGYYDEQATAQPCNWVMNEHSPLHRDSRRSTPIQRY